MIGLLLAFVLLVILLVAVVGAAFGTLGAVATVPVAAALVVAAWQVQRDHRPPAPPERQPESDWQPKPRKRDPASPD